MKFILCAPCEYDSIDPNLLCKIRRIPVPLSFLALKKCILSLSAHSFANVTCPKDFSKYIQFKGIAPELKFTSLQEILPSALRLKIKEKKSHEISRLYDFIRLLVGYIGASYKVDEIVDIGAGLGHLSRILSLLFNFKVTTIEGNEQLVNRSNKIDFTTEVSLNHKARNHEKNDVMNNFPTEWQKPERKAAFIQHENEILQSTGSKQLLVGLHTCGDFAAIILRHFISNPEAKILINLGCCYHKLNGGLDKLYRNVYDDVQAPTSHHGFPLSRKFRHFKLSYAARELACFGREQFLKRLDDSISQEAFFVNCYRAILEWIILGCPSSLNSPQNFDPILRHQGLRGVRGAERLTFWEYAEETLKEKPALRKRFNDMGL
uniref:Methyltransferase domain-containing protein n=1 Tax=Acrobeloides nanus TaxID=290746 RepID=A0A914DRN6_9BILA